FYERKVYMTSLLHFRFHSLAALACTAAAVLAGCASAPSAHRGKPSSEPLQRIQVEQPPPSADVLTNAMSGEFALQDSDLKSAARAYVQAARTSNDPAMAAQATRVAIAAAEWDEAREALARWQVLAPQDPGIHQFRVLFALHDDKPEDAYQDLLYLARQPDGWKLIAQTLAGTPNKAQTGTLLERLATPELLDDKSETWVLVSQLALKLDHKRLAQSLADRAVAKFGGADTYAWAAQLRYQTGDPEGARALFADAIKRDPRNKQLRIAYASLLGELGDNAGAAHVLAQGPQDEYSYTARAAYAARAGDKALIEPLYKEIKALPEPRSGARLNLLGELAELLERNAEALNWYSQVPEDDEHRFEAQMRSALLLDTAGKTQEALGLVHNLQARAGDDEKELGDAFLLEAEMLNKHQKGEEAVKVYDRGLKALPDDTRLLYARALLNDDLDHVDAAVDDLRHLLELKPNDADALNALGYTLADRTEKKDEALSLIQKALVLKPGEPAIIDSLGWAQYRLGHLDEAIKELRLAYEKQPDAEIAAHLGEVLWVAGQKDEARKIWEQGRNKDAKNKVLLETIQRLSS
ncbi:MAG TPA: tetratricopeptide repeat protein, partial [Rudaea sp.]|nr:tetratricopeptide repeat protein [Rudaea sp.]